MILTLMTPKTTEEVIGQFPQRQALGGKVVLKPLSRL
jgi:hypothetical protein